MTVTNRQLESPANSHVTNPVCDPAAKSHTRLVTKQVLVLSLFPGIDLMGTGFERAGFCVVRGPDKIWGGDIHNFYPPSGVFTGIIGGPPCQDFSRARRSAPSDYGSRMLGEFVRVVEAAAPVWWVMENVPTVPDVKISGYSWQRIDLRASEFGLSQSRLRHFQYGHRDGIPLVIHREDTIKASESCCMATEGRKPDRRDWAKFCQLQGLSDGFELPGMSREAAYRAVGNGVPVPMAEAIAMAIVNPIDCDICGCGCGRPVTKRATYATSACRKRMQRRREQHDECQ